MSNDEKKMKIEHLKPDVLIPYAQNARTHSEAQIAQIAASMTEFGFTNPILIAEDNTIIAGHGRLMAARLLNLATVPTIRLTVVFMPALPPVFMVWIACPTINGEDWNRRWVLM